MCPRGEVGQLDSRPRDAGLAERIGKGHDPVGVGDVQRVSNQRDPERRIQAIQEDSAQLRLPVAIGVAQQGNAVAARGACAGPIDDRTSKVILGPEIYGRRRIGFDHQDVAVGQRVDDARVHEAGRDRLDLQPARNGGRLARLPADVERHAHRRHHKLLGLGQIGVRAILLARVPALRRAGRKRTQRAQAEQ